MRAKCLTEKGTIGICSPSHLVDFEEFQHILSEIRKRGFGVQEADNLYKDTYGYLATPQERADDFNQLIADRDADLVFFGGGEGANELLPYIDYDLIRKNPKQICSYSDGTTILNAVWAMTGLETYYGQTPYLFKNITQYDEAQFMDHIVTGKAAKHSSNSAWQVQTTGKAEGILVGGYARNFALLLNGGYFPIDLKKKYILFIEDADNFGVGYVSAMLSHIEQHEFMQSVTGVIYGHSFEKDHHRLLERLKRLGKQYQIPVVYCDDFGHGTNHAILPIGRMAKLDTEEKELIYI
ncbi:MAG: LD-carboxypeptidase [Coprococcus sp.]|nr:LD-carboxypeptidase [Coprococcus sp.]